MSASEVGGAIIPPEKGLGLGGRAREDDEGGRAKKSVHVTTASDL